MCECNTCIKYSKNLLIIYNIRKTKSVAYFKIYIDIQFADLYNTLVYLNKKKNEET